MVTDLDWVVTSGVLVEIFVGAFRKHVTEPPLLAWLDTFEPS